MNKRQVLNIAAILFLLVTTLGPRGNHAYAEDSRYFPNTDKTVNDPFLTYWDEHGGLAQQGYPITNARDEKNDTDGKTYNTQYFERARFEYHPEKPEPFKVLLGLLGSEALTARYGNSQPTAATLVVPGGGSRTFQTGKTITGLFLSYWEENGGLEQQGFPITEAYNEKNAADGKTYITQYFERARFEYHPEKAEPFKVLLGLVGQEILNRKQSGGSGGQGGSGSTTKDPNWAGLRLSTPFDAATWWPSSAESPALYFFKDGMLSRYDVKTNSAPSEYPKPIVPSLPSSPFPGLPMSKIDAVASWTEGDKLFGTTLFFTGPYVVIFNVGANLATGAQVLPNGQVIPAQLMVIAAIFADIPASYQQGVDAAVVWPKGSAYEHKIFIFKGTEYVRVDAKTLKMDPGYPLPIKGSWPGLPFDTIDDVIVWPNGKAYFFEGNEYASYDIATDQTDPGYPKPIK